MSPLLLQLSNVTKSFGAVRALKGVSFALHPGEVHAVVGENGAGKSTLVKILAGVYRPDMGSMKIDGKAVELHNPAQARHAGIAVIQQEPTLFPDLNVAENVFMECKGARIVNRYCNPLGNWGWCGSDSGPFPCRSGSLRFPDGVSVC